MKRTLYLIPLLVCLALLAQAQSQVNGTVQISAGGHMGVYNALTFNTGYVITPRADPNSNITFQPGSSQTGASNSSHVNGYAEKVGTTAFTFPVGDGTTLRTVGISAPATSATYQAAYFGVNPASATLPTGAPFNTGSLASGVARVSTSEYWDVNGSNAVDLTFSWNAASNLSTVVPTGLLSNLIIVGWNGTQWVKVGSGTPTTTGTLGGTGSITVSSVTPNTYTAFTFGTSTLQLAITTNPAPATITSGGGGGVSLPSIINPTGGTAPYTYTPVDPTTGVASNTTAHGIVSVNPTTGILSYTSTTPGYSGPDAVAVKVCDSSNPALCNTTTLPVSVTLPVGSGSLDCSTAQILGITAGTPGTGNLKLTVNVSSVGTFPVTVSGSGITAVPSPYTLNATATGLQTFFIPISYSGAAFGSTVITVGNSTCSPNLSAVTPTPVITSVLNLGPACAPITAATLSK